MRHFNARRFRLALCRSRHQGRPRAVVLVLRLRSWALILTLLTLRMLPMIGQSFLTPGVGGCGSVFAERKRAGRLTVPGVEKETL